MRSRLLVVTRVQLPQEAEVEVVLEVVLGVEAVFVLIHSHMAEK